jgi:hydrogenase nickel incorporation protein HypA/HybF
MHELSMIQALYHRVEEIARQHEAKKVIRVVVEVGRLSGMMPEFFKETFVTFQETVPVLKDADLEIRRVDQEDELILREVELEIAEEAQLG